MTANAQVERSHNYRRSGLQEIMLRILLYLAILIGAVIFAMPFYWMIRTALMPKVGVDKLPPLLIPSELIWPNFQKPFAEFSFTRWFLNTAIIAVLSMIGTTLTASMTGFSFARLRFPLRDFLFIVVLATMILPEHIRMIPNYLLYTRLGWVDTFLPLIMPNWFAPAFFVFLLRQFFLTIPRDYDDAAYIDGCNPMSLFWRIHLPLSLPALGVVNIFQLTFIWNDFINPLIYLHKEPQFTVALGLRLFQGRMSNNMQDLRAAWLLAVLPTLIIFFFAQRYFVQGIVVSGVKG
ncbi:MAG: carbohydrate ABC transporter permease [Rhodocyclaceae bacterium]|nr:MAG: carbohydrate ABC transporter permease [Rhodocyclaceae bacterium]